MSPRKGKGFTLIELLIALFIFAILAVVGHLALRQMIQHQKHLTRQVAEVAEMAEAYRYLQRDLLQAWHGARQNPWLSTYFVFDMPLSGYESTGTRLAAIQSFGEPRIFWHVLDEQGIGSVGYYLKEDTWVRVWMREGDPAPQVQPLLKGIESVKISFVTPNNRFSRTNPVGEEREGLPRAIKLHLVIQGKGSFDWLILTPEGTNAKRSY